MLPLPPWAFSIFAVGMLLALAGGYWDDAWHTERGRDSFFIAPHLFIYGGVLLSGGALSGWLLLAARRAGARAALRDRARLLALIAVAATFAAGPIDDAWHRAFGRDAVLWSPPHMLGLAGTGCLAAAVLVALTRVDARWAVSARALAGGATLGAFAFALVEYDTDVPQFGEVFWLPVLAAMSAFALGLVRAVTPARFAATTAAAVHLALIAAVSLFLGAKGFEAPLLPAILPAALALDLLTARRRSAALVGAAYALVLAGSYVALTRIAGGADVPAGSLPLGALAAWAAATAAFAITLGLPVFGRRGRGRAPAAVAAAVTLLAAAPAFAHDPGQGEPYGAARLEVTTHGRTIGFAATPIGRLRARPLRDPHVVARRAGDELRAPLRERGVRLLGAVTVPDDGRWFVYLRARSGGDTVESWLPVRVGEQRTAFEPRRYAYRASTEGTTAAQVVAGAFLYAAMLALLFAVARLARLSSRAAPA